MLGRQVKNSFCFTVSSLPLSPRPPSHGSPSQWNLRVGVSHSRPSPHLLSFTQQVYRWAALFPSTRRENGFGKGFVGRGKSTLNTERGFSSGFQANSNPIPRFTQGLPNMSLEKMLVCKDRRVTYKMPQWQQVMKAGQDSPVACTQIPFSQVTKHSLSALCQTTQMAKDPHFTCAHGQCTGDRCTLLQDRLAALPTFLVTAAEDMKLFFHPNR